MAGDFSSKCSGSESSLAVSSSLTLRFGGKGRGCSEQDGRGKGGTKAVRF
jgi:hypothetical protein